MSGVMAQQGLGEQCGGLNYTGTTTCDSGATCVYVNDYWYQCQTALIPECTTLFTPITASDAFAALTPGWNLGNSLESFPMKTRGTTRLSHLILLTTFLRENLKVYEFLLLGLGTSLSILCHRLSTLWANLATSGTNYTLIEEKFKSIWTQIGVKLGCKSSKLLFESINEPAGSTESDAAELNALNDIFVDAINTAGGFNPQRGSNDDKAALELDFSLFHDNFTNIPTFIGEWDATPAYTETAARWKYFDFFVRTASKYDFSHSVFDNGAELLDRSTHTWYDETVIDILINAAAGTVNSLPESTTDSSATSLASIQNSAGISLTTSQYTFSSSGVLTLSVAYLSTPYGASSTSGIKDTLALQFSKGANLSLQVV
ncbi:hypothetical protein VF21_00884 [Pseudogymnoascus sp. 05NY08]|nr:hypothetical protein VF21_00884 [Pseudogymnoascus sp. 05NY08]